MSDLYEVEGKLYKKNSETPYTGSVIDTVPASRAHIEEGYIHLGYRAGKWVAIREDGSTFQVKEYKNGKIISDNRFFVNGEKSGEITYWDNGKQKTLKTYNELGEHQFTSNKDENGEFEGYQYSVTNNKDTVQSYYMNGETKLFERKKYKPSSEYERLKSSLEQDLIDAGVDRSKKDN